LPDLERIRGGLEALDPSASATDQGVHLLEASLPPFEHPVEGFRELPEGLLHVSVRPARLEERGRLRAALAAPGLRLLPAQLQDPAQVFLFRRSVGRREGGRGPDHAWFWEFLVAVHAFRGLGRVDGIARSEERRVGKEGRCRRCGYCTS